MKRGLLAAIAALSVLTPAIAKETKSEREMRAMIERQPEQIVPLIKVEGDGMDPSIKISTHGVSYSVGRVLLSKYTDESSFLRAIISKKTGDVVVQVYHIATYGGTGWNFFNRATYEGPDGLVEVKADRLGSDVNCSRYGCTHYEDVAFEIPLETIDAIAASFDPSNPNRFLKYRLFGQSGATIDEGIPINEVTAFSRKVHRVLGTMGPPPDTKAKPAPSSGSGKIG